MLVGYKYTDSYHIYRCMCICIVVHVSVIVGGSVSLNSGNVLIVGLLPVHCHSIL